MKKYSVVLVVPLITLNLGFSQKNIDDKQEINKDEEKASRLLIELQNEQGAPFQLDTNLALSFKNFIEVGAGFSTSSTINAFLGFYLLKNFRAIYSYSQGSGDSPLRNTHGIMLNYRARRWICL